MKRTKPKVCFHLPDISVFACGTRLHWFDLRMKILKNIPQIQHQ